MTTYMHKNECLPARLQKIEEELVLQLSSKTVIENALLLGTPSHAALLQRCRCIHRHHLCESYHFTDPNNTQVCVGRFTELPYQRDSMDFIILSHVLELVTQPQVVLEEVAECLSQRGTLLLFASSSTSLTTSKQLLVNSGLTVIDAKSFFSLFSHYPENKFMRFLDQTLTPYLPFLSHAYYIVAKKLVTPATPIPLQSRSPAKLALALDAQCATRIGHSSEC